MRRFPKGKPWHLVVNFTGPHEPWDITRGMEERCRKVPGFPQPNGSRQFPPETHEAIRQNYSAMVENIDRWVGVFVAQLKKRRELENTLIVYSSDHGEMLGDHDRWGKSVPYQASVGVPLYVAGPGVRSGLVTDALVSVMDLTATFLDYAGLPRPNDMDSRSLRPLLEGQTRSHRECVLSGLARWRLVWDGRFKLVQGFDHAPLLFDLEADPLENQNLAPQTQDLVERLSKWLR
jgi:arylsulfatase A-like enzyme